MTRLPPGPKRPAVLQMIAYVSNPYTHFERQRARFGDVFTIRLPGVGTQVVVSSPEGLKQLAAGSYEALGREAGSLDFLLGSRALIFQDGLRHRRLRNVMTPAFQGDRMRSYGPVMEQAAREVLAQRDPRAYAPIQPDMKEIALRVILHCVFGLDRGARFDRMRLLLIEFLDGMFQPSMFAASMLLGGRRLLGTLERLGERRRARLDAAQPFSRLPFKGTAERLGAIDAILYDEIARRRDSGEERDDILSLLVHARDEQGERLRPEELRDQLIMLLVGGHETTANALCWALYLLARRPDVVARIRAEQESTFGASFDALRARELPYLGAVIQETMRLLPIAIGVARRLRHDVNIAGYTLKADTVAVPSMYLAQRDPRSWERPDDFEPERFLNKKQSMTAHFPFGTGVWRCLGAAFAEYELRVVLSHLLAHYDIELDPRERAQPVIKGVTIAPASGLKLRLAPRSAS